MLEVRDLRLVYPNGYEALVLDQALRLRFREGFNRMVPAEKGKVYPIKKLMKPVTAASVVVTE